MYLCVSHTLGHGVCHLEHGGSYDAFSRHAFAFIL